MEGLGIDSIFSGEEYTDLFTNENSDSNNDSEEHNSEEESNNNNNNNQEEQTTEEINPEGLFTESVGSEENNQGNKEGTSSEEATSPNFYSSIANALKEDSVFPDLEDDVIKDIKGPEDFAKMFEALIQSRLEERNKRIDEALNAGVEGSVIRNYETTLSYLGSITNDVLDQEDELSETLRKQLIFQDLINRRYTKELAIKKVQLIVESGRDKEEAKEALESNKAFYTEGYNNIIKDAQEEAKKEESNRKSQAESLRKSILESNKAFGDLEIDKATRQKVYDNINKPVFKDKETGNLYTALLKYELDNHEDFIKNVGLIFTLTNGFKDWGPIINKKVKTEINKGMRELETKLTNQRHTGGGSSFVSGTNDSESFINKKWTIDI